MVNDEQPPGLLAGLKGIPLELRYAFQITKQCPACGASWNGWYAKAYMNYCHHCGAELVEP